MDHDEQQACEGAVGRKATLNRARQLARNGRWEEALLALRSALAEGTCTQAEALDLQARMCAQQGRLLQAESCWVRALELDPRNVAYAEGLAALHRRARPFLRRWIAAAAAGGMLLVLAGLPALLQARALQRLRQSLDVRLDAADRAGGEYADGIARLSKRIEETTATLARRDALDAGFNRQADTLALLLNQAEGRIQNAAADPLRAIETSLREIRQREEHLLESMAEATGNLEKQVQQLREDGQQWQKQLDETTAALHAELVRLAERNPPYSPILDEPAPAGDAAPASCEDDGDPADTPQ
jgi:tetratricopeptide (TPR) repeat protein